MEDWGRHSHLRPEILAPMESLRNLWGNYDQMTSRWRWNTVWTYMLKEPGADLDGLTDQLPAFTDRYFSEYFSSEETIHLAFQPLTDIWLHSDLKVEISETGSFWQVLLFSVVAVLILVIACVNYVNLSTAQSALRAKEVGVRKTLGAENSGLMRQFMIESGVFTATAVAIGVLIAWLGAPYTETFTGRELSFGLLGGFELFVIIAVLIIAVTALAGFYPSVILSSLKPIRSLRGGGGGGRKGGKAGLRQGLTIFQFAVTAFLITGAAMVYVQYQHLQQRDMGFDPEDVIVVPSSMTTAIWFYDDFRERALTHHGVEAVSGSKTVIGGEDFLRYQMVPEGYGADQERSYSKIFVMHDFVEAMGIEMAAGRSFSEEYSTDPQQALLINEAMVEELDWGTPEEALGRTFRLGEQEKTVVGVTRDFNHSYLRQELEPLVLELPSDENQMVANIEFIKVKFSSGDSWEAITHLEAIWDEIDQTHPFEYYFMQDKLEEIYASEGRLSSLMGIFSLFAIVIAALGLAGLGSYTMYTRTREVAIRKTLGASATGIFMMLSRDYLKLVLIAHVLALPVAWWFISRWFSGFPYQVNLPFYFTVIFGISIIASVLIALASISAQSVKAAYRDPAKSLRND
jgi:putative ABC transport system permease protein